MSKSSEFHTVKGKGTKPCLQKSGIEWRSRGALDICLNFSAWILLAYFEKTVPSV